MNRTLKYILGITVAFVLPLSLYFIARHFSDGRIPMPKYFQPEHIDTIEKDGKVSYDTTFHKVKEFVGTNQLGQEVALNKDLKGKTLVVDFIFTSCKTICPKISSAMQMLQQSYKKKHPEWVQFISISVDPQNDSVTALRTFANRFTKEHDTWWFIRGDYNATADYAKNELALQLSDGDVPGDIIHSKMLVLIDSARHIRGYYDGLDTMALRQLADDIAILSLEKHPKK